MISKSSKFRSPSLEGEKGLPPGVGASKDTLPKKGVRSPNQYGKRGEPGKAGFPGYPAARD